VLLPEFLVGLMASRHGRTFFEITAKKTTNLAATNSTTLRCFPLWLPEVEEQEHILRWTRERVASLDSTATRAESEASLMREYRTRLIADVVTGKLDVREVAAELPAEADEPESLDTVEVSDDVSEDAGDGDNADLEQVDETAQA
jgi:type I restriction enzyme S subunit